MSISKGGLIQWTVGSGLEGNTYNVRILVIDQDGLAAGRNFSVTVNHTPKWVDLGPQSGKEQNLLAFNPIATDADETDLVVTASGLPTGSTYDAASGFSWTPSVSQVGTYDVRFTATDPHGAKSELVVKVTVLANAGPTLAALGQVDILAGESVNVQLDAVDADDDKSALAYRLNNAPEGMQVSETGLVTWATQSGTHSGEYTAEAVVSDPLGAGASQQLKVVVNGAPVVESIDSLTLKIGDSVTVTVAASDPEGGKLTFKALNNPDGFKGNARNGFKGKFSWITKSAAAGDYKLDIEVGDTAGLKSVVSVNVTLKANIAPTVESLAPVAVDAGDSVQVQVVADDVDDDNSTLRYVLENAPNGMQVSGDGLIQWSVDNQAETAVHSVTVIVVDGGNAMGKQVLVVTVDANKAPAVEPIEPIVVKVGDNVGFTVSATDSEGSKLTYKALNTPAGFKRKIRNGYNGVFLWYTTKASAGNYKIDIEVSDAGGLKTVVAAQITLEPKTALTLHSAPAVVGPFAAEAEAVIDEDAKTITVATAGGMRFYRLLSGDDTKLKITSIAVKDDKAVMGYKPAGE